MLSNKITISTKCPLLAHSHHKTLKPLTGPSCLVTKVPFLLCVDRNGCEITTCCYYRVFTIVCLRGHQLTLIAPSFMHQKNAERRATGERCENPLLLSASKRVENPCKFSSVIQNEEVFYFAVVFNLMQFLCLNPE